jgi:hypothetical protein
MNTFGLRSQATITHVYINTALTLTGEVAAETGINLTTEQKTVNLVADKTVNTPTIEQITNLTIEQVSQNG